MNYKVSNNEFQIKTPSFWLGVGLLFSALSLNFLFSISSGFTYAIGSSVGVIISSGIISLPIFLIWKYATISGRRTAPIKSFNIYSAIVVFFWAALCIFLPVFNQLIKNNLSQNDKGPMTVTRDPITSSSPQISYAAKTSNLAPVIPSDFDEEPWAELQARVSSSLKIYRTKFTYNDQTRVLTVNVDFENIGTYNINKIAGNVYYNSSAGETLGKLEFTINETIPPNSRKRIEQVFHAPKTGKSLRDIEIGYLVLKFEQATK